MARPKPWKVDDESRAVIEPLLPKVERRTRHPGRKRHPDRLVFQGILFVLHTGISWEYLPQELGFGSGMTRWRRLAEGGRGWRVASTARGPPPSAGDICAHAVDRFSE
ncbi:hypothetical protein SAM23877_7406 [Streptomyces ambofaciens ATCC 23877]|uniref:Insertion element IS402-like domain-containing protein n=1 Tax=Streptomyces ambofaciens (strain ATCC 23877 / 3486 / DSM 40053 / JCM 4204 / NBRC 12836 / NRRL B-2516) TaxID=278992 RepID=A0A0K2B5W6_STRA7|nr:hypothetical protein SAM23877_7406 [Streptomyces ambofaciens ATCC 23877]